MASRALVLLTVFLQTTISLSIPSRAQSKVNLAGLAAPGPTSTPVSDWQKNNKTAQWAEGYPKTWGSEEVKYTQVKKAQPHSRSLFGPGTVTPDDKFLIMINDTNTRITNLDTGTTVVDIAQAGDDARVTVSPKGGYDLLISKMRAQYSGYDIYHYSLSEEGNPKGDPVKVYGETTTFDTDVFKGRRFVADQRNEAFVYDLDDPNFRLTLDGHTDSVTSATFSPDGKYVATAAWDGKGKLWSAQDGSFIADFESTTAQNWVTRFSPDSKYVAIAAPRYVKIYTVANLVAPPTNSTTSPILIEGFGSWVRTLQWSPDSKYIAGGSFGQVLVYSLAQNKVVQYWALASQENWEVVDVTWLEGGKRIAYRVQGALEMYDFDSNLKYKWGPGEGDTWLNGFNVAGTFQLKKKGWIGGFDWDHSVRFWKYPAA
ncbi:hypothetical protein N0V90_009251 [Kalmusia sp. IMI 367209]|nr:hypothetical protein N0V90_009251 [Kalmusia sp. IMI 367209]